jgi:hypothetical protein
LEYTNLSKVAGLIMIAAAQQLQQQMNVSLPFATINQ